MTDVSHASLSSDHDGASKVVVQSDSKLIAAGNTNYLGSGVQFAAVRYNADGTLDTSFGNGGVV
ncbi:MAG TPA: delta-60 repeat domain-containing protein, partial [Blastocatellia bacterium]|nr:delta-60 repeat domain-containing protein [Blastocatellia bacterium]